MTSTDQAHAAESPADRELVARAKAGSMEAFELLVVRYEGRLLRFVRTRLGRDTDAEDIVQETLVKAYRALPRFRDGAEPGPWLFAIARNGMISHLRVLGRRSETAWFEQAGDETREEPLQTERKDWLQSLWDHARTVLDARAFDALWFRYGEDLSVDQTAQALGCRPGTAKVLLHRARRRLLERIPNRVWEEGWDLAGAADRRPHRVGPAEVPALHPGVQS